MDGDHGPDGAKITIDEIKGAMASGRSITFLDTRSPEAWAASDVMIPGAIRIPADQVDRNLSAIPDTGTIVTYCT